jgi:hypothetical protein
MPEPNNGVRSPNQTVPVRMWISGLAFVALATVTFVAGEDNRWISVPAAIVAAIALIDFFWTNQRRRKPE